MPQYISFTFLHIKLLIYALIPVQLNRGQVGLEYIGRDMNIEPVWIQGITGLNVTVAVVDDGKHHIP